MRVLIEVAAVCCVVLLGIAIALWWSMRAKEEEPATAPKRVSLAQPRPGPHPRLDLAAGTAPSSQSVHSASRRRGLQPETEQPQESSHPRRPDWAFYNEAGGDLRDPDSNRAPAGGVLRPTGSLSRPESR